MFFDGVRKLTSTFDRVHAPAVTESPRMTPATTTAAFTRQTYYETAPRERVPHGSTNDRVHASRACLLARGRPAEARPRRLLPGGRACARPARARPAVHDQAPLHRPSRTVRLGEGRAGSAPRVDPHLPSAGEVARRRAGPVPARQRRVGAALDGRVRRGRSARLDVALRPSRPAGLRPVRPRPGGRGGIRRGRRGGAAPPRGAGRSR